MWHRLNLPGFEAESQAELLLPLFHQDSASCLLPAQSMAQRHLAEGQTPASSRVRVSLPV